MSSIESIAPTSVDEKENKVRASKNNSSSGKFDNENTLVITSDLTAPSSLNKNDFGPLTPVQLNVPGNRADETKDISKSSGPLTRQEQIQKVVGALHQHMISLSSKQNNVDDVSSGVNESFFEEGSLITEVAMYAQAEEEKQLKRIIDDQNVNLGNKHILNQSKKIVGFLGGSIMTALEQNLANSKTSDEIFLGGKFAADNNNTKNSIENALPSVQSGPSTSENPSLNYFVGDIIGKLGSINPLPSSDMVHTQSFRAKDSNNRSQSGVESPEVQNYGESIDDIESHDATLDYNEAKSNLEHSPTTQPKAKYWETLMLRSGESKDGRHLYFESPDSMSQRGAQPMSLSTPELKRNKAACMAVTTTAGIQTNHRVETRTSAAGEDQDKCVETSPQQSTISIPEDYSPGEGACGIISSPKDRGIISRKDHSPGSLMFNMISEATNIETPLVYKCRQSVTGKNSLMESSPANSDFGNKLSSATAMETPQHGLTFEKGTAIIENQSSVNIFSSQNTDQRIASKDIAMFETAKQETTKKQVSNTKKYPSSNETVRNLLDRTPVKSNKTDVFRCKSSNYSLESDCDMSEDGSIYTSVTHPSSIQSNTPRNRRVLEWIGPNASNTVSWPAPSMTTNLRSSESPERQLPVAKVGMMGTAQYLNIQKQVRAKTKSSKKSDFSVPRLGSSASPTSLPSLLGSPPYNEVSDLESPNINMLPLNFKFSDEESTIQSQSIHDASEINSLRSENLLPPATPQSLMTVATPTVGYPTDEEFSCNKDSLNDAKDPQHQKLLVETFTIPSSKGSSSPHSTISNKSFKRDTTDDNFKYFICLKRCITFGMLVALAGATTVIAIVFRSQAKEDQSVNIDGDLITGIGRQTASPTSNIIFYPQTSPPTIESSSIGTSMNLYSTFYPTSSENIGLESTMKPSAVDSISDALLEPSTAMDESSTVDPTSSFQATLMPSTSSEQLVANKTLTPYLETTFEATASNKASPTSSPSLIPQPASETIIEVEPSFMPSFRPTPAPMSIPTFSSEKIQEITWDRVVKGEDVLSKSDGDVQLMWYHAADETPGLQLKVINAAKGDHIEEKLKIAIDDYSRSEAVSSLKYTSVSYEILCAPPKMGEIKVCSEGVSENNGIGSVIFFVREDYIVSALIRISENVSSPSSDALLQYALCHQLGHSLGVMYNDADFGLSSCMKDFGENVIVDGDIIVNNQKLQHPNSDDLDFLVTLYGRANSRMLRGR